MHTKPMAVAWLLIWWSQSSGVMTKAPRKKDESTDERSPAETERVASATLRRLLSTPPKPHKEMVGKAKKTKNG